MASFEGKVIALTGAASGIGLACATLLADRGATLSLADLNVAALEKVVQSFKAGSSGRIAIHHVDVRDRQSVRSFYQKTREELGPINGCGNIAGVMGKNSNVHNIWELDPKEWALQMDVNTTGVYNCLAEQLSPGIMAEGGTIVNMASAAGLFGMPKNAAYCASKFAVVGLTKAVAGEGAERGIRVNCVCPGPVDTPMLQGNDNFDEQDSLPPGLPIRRRAKPQEIARTVAFLLGDESTYTTGSAYTVDGGWQC